MPRVPLHALIWSRNQDLYELYTRGQLVQRFQPGDQQAWQRWLRDVTSLAFHSPFGSLNVYQEARPRGGLYWYAYHTHRGHTRKRYLGWTARVSLARLEETAQILWKAIPLYLIFWRVVSLQNEAVSRTCAGPGREASFGLTRPDRITDPA